MTSISTTTISMTLSNSIDERDDGEPDGSVSSRHISHLADMISEATGAEREASLNWLLRTRRGLMLVQRTLGKRLKKETPPMNDTLSAIVKRFGLTAVCKGIVDDGPGGISEHEITKVITEAAQRAYPELRPAAAFSKMFCSEDSVLLRQAVAACRTFATQPAHKQAVLSGSAMNVSSGSAMNALVAKAAELRQREPSLTPAQSFAKVYSDPANVELARAERAANRPHA